MLKYDLKKNPVKNYRDINTDYEKKVELYCNALIIIYHSASIVYLPCYILVY